MAAIALTIRLVYEALEGGRTRCSCATPTYCYYDLALWPTPYHPMVPMCRIPVA